eukprot:3959971-Prymnesium_polylepis.2
MPPSVPPRPHRPLRSRPPTPDSVFAAARCADRRLPHSARTAARCHTCFAPCHGVAGACMAEDDLYNVWLPKLGLAKDHHLPQHNTQKVEDLIGKRMVSEAYLRKRKSPAVRRACVPHKTRQSGGSPARLVRPLVQGNTEFVAGARAAMTRNAEAVQTFHDTTILNRTTDE